MRGSRGGPNPHTECYTLAQFLGSYHVYDLQLGWHTHLATDLEDIVFEQRVEWYWGDIDVSAIHVKLAEGLATSIFAQVTVWFRGTGVVHYVADAPSLAAYLTQILPGVQALAKQDYLVIE